MSFWERSMFNKLTSFLNINCKLAVIFQVYTTGYKYLHPVDDSLQCYDQKHQPVNQYLV
jgi:hypothetical protein